LTPALLLAAALSGPAHALDGNDALRLQLAGGVEVEGWFYSCADGVLTVSGDNALQRIPLVSIVAVERDGEPLPMETFRAEAADQQARLDAFRADPPPHPPAGVVIGAAVLWAGAAPASVGDWKRAAGYSLVEGVLVGTAVANINSGSAAVLVPLAALDVLFKGYAAGEAVRVTRKRRARLRPSDTPTPSESPTSR
jgi:hypothetical protein